MLNRYWNNYSRRVVSQFNKFRFSRYFAKVFLKKTQNLFKSFVGKLFWNFCDHFLFWWSFGAADRNPDTSVRLILEYSGVFQRENLHERVTKRFFKRITIIRWVVFIISVSVIMIIQNCENFYKLSIWQVTGYIILIKRAVIY